MTSYNHVTTSYLRAHDTIRAQTLVIMIIDDLHCTTAVYELRIGPWWPSQAPGSKKTQVAQIKIRWST